MSADRLAVVGTDTGVGKTVVTAAIARLLVERGTDVRAVKPAQTGHPPDDDAAVVAETCGDRDASTCPYYFQPPLAPRVAAAEFGTAIEYDRLRASIESAISDADVGLVEGVGGLRVPLTREREIVDLVADLDCRALVVADSGLGTLNHTALTVDALERRDVPVTAVICNRYEGATVAERTNPVELQRQLEQPVVTVEFAEATDPVTIAHDVAGQLDSTGAFETVLGPVLGSDA